MATELAVLLRLLVWGLLGVIPYVGLMAIAVVNALVDGIIDVRELLLGAIWVAFYALLPPVFAAILLGGMDVGLLLALRRATFNIWLRAAIPAFVVLVMAMALFSAYVYMTMFNLYGTGHYYAWAATCAATVAAVVYASHVYHYRSNHTEPLAEHMQP